MSNPIYLVDCIRYSNGDPIVGWSRPWFVQRIADGATLAQCSSREAAERSMAKRIAKDRAKQEIG